MLMPSRPVRIWIAIEPAHMGRNHDGLVALVKERFADDPFSGALYVFMGKRRDRCKILWWEPSGFAIHYKRLESARLWLPPVEAGTTRVVLDSTQLAMLLDGIDLSRVQRPKHWRPQGIDKAG